MPKYKSELVREETIGPDGKKVAGITAWVPVDDAAKMEKDVTQKAIDHMKYVPSSPNERKKLVRANAEKVAADQLKKGKWTPEEAEAYLKSIENII